MPVLNYTDFRTARGKGLVSLMYLTLALGALTMVYPFLIMLSGSLATGFDYERRSPAPRHLWSREDRLMRFLCALFPLAQRGAMRQMRGAFPDMPAEWQTWPQIGDDRAGTDRWASRALSEAGSPRRRRNLEAMATDFHDFTRHWDLRETILAFDARDVAPFLRRRYGTLERYNAAWEVSIDDFFKAIVPEWSGEPIDQPGYVPVDDVRYRDLLLFREAYRSGRLAPAFAGRGAYAGLVRPAGLRHLWEDVWSQRRPRGAPMWFPVPADAPPTMLAAWRDFLRNQFPLRHVTFRPTAAARADWREFLKRRFRTVAYMNQLLELNAPSWDDVELTETVPAMPVAKVWMDYMRERVRVQQWELRATLPELAFQKFASQRHRGLAGVNAAYGRTMRRIEELEIPLREAVLVTFLERERPMAAEQSIGNYRAVADYLFNRGLAVRNTVILVALSLIIALTVNPLAGYALSRFRLRATERVVVFCLATMAFPAAVTAIPGFLLLRDLGLLNTFAALVLPSAANGMTIFLLKGFFDSLPRELFEAATIDGAPEWTVLWRISIPLVKPILAVSMLSAFLAAYNGWEWALIVCQDQRIWTISVWTYQFYQSSSATPSVVMAAFVLSSLPVLVVFLACQKVILRGIILPQLK